eukprot:363426-Chlamydomonas_euryale.AAC.3
METWPLCALLPDAGGWTCPCGPHLRHTWSSANGLPCSAGSPPHLPHCSALPSTPPPHLLQRDAARRSNVVKGGLSLTAVASNVAKIVCTVKDLLLAEAALLARRDVPSCVGVGLFLCIRWLVG